MPYHSTTLPKCIATNKHGRQCGEVAVRKGFCLYHQPEETTKRLMAKLARNHKEREKLEAELQAVNLL